MFRPGRLSSGLIAITVFAACQHATPGVPVEYENGMPADPARVDRGIGAVTFASSPGGAELRTDTLLVRRERENAAPVVARFLLHHRSGGEWSYELVAAPPARTNAIEFAYEEEALPIDSILPGERWARTLYAFTSSGNPIRGWVRLDSTRVRHMLWSDVLLERSLYFPDPAQRILYDSPGGARVQIPLTAPGASNLDYELVPLRAEGDWMQVRVVVPSTCSGTPPVPTVERTTWIRYLDAAKRPTVWYYSRGC